MEEKLYFKPENYNNPKPTKQVKKLQRRKGLKLFVVFLLVVGALVIILWLLRGKTTISGQFPTNIRNESLECVSNTIVYPKTNQVDTDDKELKLTLVFHEEKQLISAALKYTLHFSSENEAYSATARAHIQFDKALAANGLNSETFNNKFSFMDKDLVITLHLDNSISSDYTSSYFLIDPDLVTDSLEDYRRNYEAQGFKCHSTTDKK